MMCPKAFNIRDHFTKRSIPDNAANVYHTTQYDNDIAPSIEDRRFIEIVSKGIYKNDPGNGKCASHSAIVRYLYRAKEDTHSDACMGYYALLNANHKWSKMLDNGHAVSVPEREICFAKTLDECGTHLISEFTIQKKPDQIRVIFNPSALYQGKSLNRVFLTGHLIKNLVGVLSASVMET